MKTNVAPSLSLLALRAGAVVAVVLAGACQRGAKTETAEAPAVVGVTPLQTRTFRRTLTVQGRVQAVRYAVVAARVPGTLERLAVDEGDPVEAGRTVLFEVDRVKLEKAAEAARRGEAVALAGVREKEASLAAVQADADKAAKDHGRYQRLATQELVSADVMEQQETRYVTTRALVKHAETLVDLAREQAGAAGAGRAAAEKDLGDATVVAPLSGRVTMRLREPGERVDPGAPVVRVEDPTDVEIVAFLPAEFYEVAVTGRTAVAVSLGDLSFTAPLAFRSPVIDERLHAFEIKVAVPAGQAAAVSGRTAVLKVVLSERVAPGVPVNAVQSFQHEKLIFTVREGVARGTAVVTGIEDEGWVELPGCTLTNGEPVVTVGGFQLRDGRPVRVRTEDKQP